MEELKKELESIVPTLSKEELDSRFPQIAEFFIKNYGVETRGKTYLINEIEFYYYSPLYDDLRIESNKTITYERNAPAGSWFIHDYGVDLTFRSDKEQGFGGGILIRSIEDSSKPDSFITGPVNCVNEYGTKPLMLLVLSHRIQESYVSVSEKSNSMSLTHV